MLDRIDKADIARKEAKENRPSGPLQDPVLASQAELKETITNVIMHEIVDVLIRRMSRGQINAMRISLRTAIVKGLES